jgi:hypothetical protein
MATNFPTSLDSLTNPQGTDSVAAVSHAAQHANANDAIEALQARVGVTGSTVATSLTYRIAALENQAVDTEAIQDLIGLMVGSNTETGVTVTYDDDNGKLNFAVADQFITHTTTDLTEGTNLWFTNERVDDRVNDLLIAGTGIGKTYNDIAGTLTIDASAAITSANSYTDTAISSLSNSISNPILGYVPIADVGQLDGVASLDSTGFVPNTQLNIDERIQDTAALMITSATHSNVTVSYDDATGRLSFTGIPLTQEQVQDFIAPLFAHSFHTNVTATYDDTNNRVVLEGSGGGGSGTGGSLTNSWFLGA